jgi:hypothetical protein
MKTCWPGFQERIVGILICNRPQGRTVRVAVCRPLMRWVRTREVVKEKIYKEPAAMK